MDSVLLQIGPGGDWISWIVFMMFWVVFLFFYPRLMVSQIMWKLDRTARELELMSEKSLKFIIKEISDKPDKRLRDSVARFFEFFMIKSSLSIFSSRGIIRVISSSSEILEARYADIRNTVKIKAADTAGYFFIISYMARKNRDT